MQLRNAPKLLLAIVFVVAALAVGSDAGKPITVKGYVLDSACAFKKLLPFAGQKVTASGKVFQRGGSSALVIEKIEPSSDQK